MVWGGLIVVLDLRGIAQLGQTGKAAAFAASLGVCFGFLWAGALLFKVISNRWNHRPPETACPTE
jgi:hypothetical protein